MVFSLTLAIMLVTSDKVTSGTIVLINTFFKPQARACCIYLCILIAFCIIGYFFSLIFSITNPYNINLYIYIIKVHFLLCFVRVLLTEAILCSIFFYNSGSVKHHFNYWCDIFTSAEIYIALLQHISNLLNCLLIFQGKHP